MGLSMKSFWIYKRSIVVILVSTLLLAYAYVNSNSEAHVGGVMAHAHCLTTKEECIKLLGTNGKRLINYKKRTNKNIYPIKITLENNTGKTLSFHDIDLKTESKKTVHNRIVQSHWPLTIFLGVLVSATIAYPAAVIIGSVAFVVPCLFGTASMASAVGCAVISGGITYCGVIGGSMAVSATTSNRLSKSCTTALENLTGLETLTLVKPLEKHTFFIFVSAKNYKNKFTINFTDETTKEIVPCKVTVPALTIPVVKRT